MKNPKEKGNRLERDVAKLLSDWSGVKFMRTPMSGAIHNFNDKRVVSDIVAPLSLGKWPFSIECKNTENSWEINTFIEETAMFWKQWQQCYDDSLREDSIPMLIFTKNYRDIFIAITEDTFNKINIDIPNKVIVQNTKFSLVIVLFKQFLQSTTVESLINCYR